MKTMTKQETQEFINKMNETSSDFNINIYLVSHDNEKFTVKCTDKYHYNFEDSDDTCTFEFVQDEIAKDGIKFLRLVKLYSTNVNWLISAIPEACAHLVSDCN